MGKPVKRDLDLYRGDDYTHVITFVDNQDPPEPIDISEFNFKAQIRDRPENGTVVYAEFDIDVTNAATGVLVISLPAPSTRIKPGYWDLQADNGDITATWIYGTVNVYGDVTISTV